MLSNLIAIILAMLESKSKGWFTKLTAIAMVKRAIVEFADVEVEEDIFEVIIGIVVESAMFWYHERIFDLWEKTKIESNQLYIKKRNKDKREREKEIRIGLKIPSSSLIVD